MLLYQKVNAKIPKLPHFITMKSSARKDIKRTDYDEHRRETSNKRNSIQQNLFFYEIFTKLNLKFWTSTK